MTELELTQRKALETACLLIERVDLDSIFDARLKKRFLEEQAQCFVAFERKKMNTHKRRNRAW